MDDFYVTLPSSVKNSQFVNTSSRFVTRLPQVLRLEKDKYNVAVTDIIYPYSFTNVGRSLNYWIHFKNREPICLTFPAAQYDNIEEIIETLNDEPPVVRRKRSLPPDFDDNGPRAKRASIREKFNKTKQGREADEKKARTLIDKVNEVQEAAEKEKKKGETFMEKVIAVILEGENAEKKSQANLDKFTKIKMEADKDKEKTEEEAAARAQTVIDNVNNLQNGLPIVVEDEQPSEQSSGEPPEQEEPPAPEEGSGEAPVVVVPATPESEEEPTEEFDEPDEEDSQSAESTVGETVVPEQIPPSTPIVSGAVVGGTSRRAPSSGRQNTIQQKYWNIRREQLDHITGMRAKAIRDKQERISKHAMLRKKWAETLKAGSRYHEVALDVYRKPEDKNEYENLKSELVRIRSMVRVSEATSARRYLEFSNINGQIEIKFLDENILFVEFEPSCSYFLGFHDPIVRDSCIAPSKVDFFGNVSTIYLYCDIVDPIIVGDQKNSLLSVIPCKGKYGEMIHHTIPYPRYLPIMNNTIDSVKVEFLSEFAEPINFHWGSTIIVLHFKKND